MELLLTWLGDGADSEEEDVEDPDLLCAEVSGFAKDFAGAALASAYFRRFLSL